MSTDKSNGGAFRLNATEMAMLDNLPEDNIIELAAELDLLIPESIQRADLLARAVQGILARAMEEGLPFSKYDRDDLEQLPPAHLKALAECARPAHPPSMDCSSEAVRSTRCTTRNARALRSR